MGKILCLESSRLDTFIRSNFGFICEAIEKNGKIGL